MSAPPAPAPEPSVPVETAPRTVTRVVPPQRDYSWTVYGSILVTTLLVVESQADESPDFIGLTIVISIAVFWLAHAWSEVIGLRVHGPVGLRPILEIVRDQATILVAAVVPVALLGIRLTGVYSDATAVNLALAVSVVQLFLWGIVIGRAARATWPTTLLIALVDLGFGLVVVGLKVVAIHH